LYILPGWGLGQGPFESLIALLRQQLPELPIRQLNLPGYGDTPFTTDPEHAVDALLRQIEPGSSLLGWSLGAMLALMAAARPGNRLDKVILVAGTSSFVQRPGWEPAMPPAQLAEFTQAVASDIEAMLPRFIGGFNRGDARAKAVTRTLIDTASSRPDSTTLLTGLHWLRDLDLRPIAAKNQRPTLILHGEADPLMPVAAAQWLATHCPKATLHTFADCAHASFVSEPAAFCQHVAAFLASSSANA
jgi:pimeloyl-[acyl-carrier protein] methyl ester esterase